MQLDQIDSKKRELEEMLIKFGWSIVNREHNLNWSLKELWTLESSWSPIGQTMFLGFVTDAQGNNNWSSVEGKTDVWAIGVANLRGVPWLDTISLKRWQKENKLENFVKGFRELGTAEAKTSSNG